MSIRFRLTLLYTAILALTLVAFSSIVYITQSRTTYDAIATAISAQARHYASSDWRLQRSPDYTAIATLPGRWLQTRDADGNVIGRSADLADGSLPLSDVGLRSVQMGAPWIETGQLDDEPLLIYNQPVVVQDHVVRIVQVGASIAQRDESLNTLRVILILGSSFAIIAAFAVGWVLAGMALRPIHRITHTAQAIGVEQDLSRRVQHVGPNDEIGQLAKTFNAMLEKLESAYRQVEQTLQAQRRFVADASHELRTPLTTIRGNVDLLRYASLTDPAERKEVLDDTRDETDRLIRLVNELLVLARADVGRPLRREPLQLKPLLQDLYRQAKLLAPDRQVDWDISLDAVVVGDRDALKQVLLILLDNARVHTPATASIGVGAIVSEETVGILVRDSGPGIAPAVLPHIFKRFFRGDAARSGKGLGLGLSIADELVQGQGGTLTVESQPGKGSVFTVRLPRAVDPAQVH